MFREKIALILVVMLLTAMLLACDVLDDETDGDVTDGDLNSVVRMVDAGDSFELGFSEGTEEYHILPFWPVETESSTGYTIEEGEAPQIDGDDSVDGDDIADGDTADGDSFEDGDSSLFSRVRMQPVSAFEQAKPAWISEAGYQRLLTRQQTDKSLRERGRRLLMEGRYTGEQLLKRQAKRARLMVDCGAGEVEWKGSCQSDFDVTFMDFNESTQDIHVQVRAVGEHVALAVDEDDAASFSESDIQSIVEKFDSVVYPRDQFFFGSSTIDGTDWTDADQNGVHLLIATHLVNDAGVAGFFNPADFADAGVSGATGNAADILWIQLPQSADDLGSILGTVGHEYYHLMMFGIKGGKYGAAEEVWLDENLAHFAEDASGYGIDNIATTAAFLSDASAVSWAFSEDSVETRGMGFLFMRYLFEQQGGASYSSTDGGALTDNGGAAFLTSLVRTSDTGFDAVKAALDISWDQAFFNWMAAVSLDDLSISDSSKYAYDELYDDPITGQQIGVCTNCSRTTAEGQSVTFMGFSNDYSEELSDYNDGVLTSTGLNCWIAKGDSNRYFSTTGEDADVAFAVVRVK